MQWRYAIKNNYGDMLKNISGFKTGPGLFRLLLAFMVVVSHTILLFPFGHYAVYVFLC